MELIVLASRGDSLLTKTVPHSRGARGGELSRCETVSTPSKDLAFASGFGLGALASLGVASGAAFSRDIVFVSASALVDLLRRAGKCRVEQNGFALEASNARAAPAAAGRPTPVADLPRRNGSRRPVRSRG